MRGQRREELGTENDCRVHDLRVQALANAAVTASRTLVVVVLHWFCAWMHSVYRSAEKMGSPLLRCPPRVPYLPGTRLHLRAGFVMSRFFKLATLDPTHLRTSHLENASRPFASKRPLLAPPWRNHGSSQKPRYGPRARYAQSDFDRKSCTPALYASFVWYASLRLHKPRGMHSLMRTYIRYSLSEV